MGPLPSEEKADVEALKDYEFLIQNINPPFSDQELRELVLLFGTDSCYGLAWTLLHLIGSAPNWPTLTLGNEQGNEWKKLLQDRREKFCGT